MDCPEVANALRTGYPHGEPDYPHCPVCEAETDTFYKNQYGDIVGCEECLRRVDAWEEMEDSKCY
jgi:hypothetical protein